MDCRSLNSSEIIPEINFQSISPSVWLSLRKKFNIILIAGILFLQSCDLFSTRGVETPSDPRSTFIQPTSADIVLDNLEFAIAEKNLNNYIKCFVDTTFSARRFRYFPDAVSQSSYPVFLSWSLNNERAYFSNLISFSTATSPSNLFRDNTVFNTSIDSTIVDMDYILIFDHSRSNVAKQTKGKLRFIMGADERGLWSIHSWYDFLNANNDTTWSVLKANFVN